MKAETRNHTGMSPAWPHCWTRFAPVDESMTYQLPSLGRHTAKSVLPQRIQQEH